MCRRSAMPSRPRAASGRPAKTCARASSRSRTSPSAASSRPWRSPLPTTKAAAGCRSSRSRAASSSRRPSGSAAIRRCSPRRSPRLNSACPGRAAARSGAAQTRDPEQFVGSRISGRFALHRIRARSCEAAVLALNNIEVVYDNVILVLRGVSLRAEPGRITALLGANGAGKTTTLKAISGILGTERGRVTKGNIELDGERLDQLPAHDVVQRGVVQVFEGRRVFPNLTVEENLIAGGHTRADGKLIREGIERVYDVFPRLKERRRLQSGYLSGGEQQMMVIGRALMSDPKAILLDEPSLGLAPLIVEEIFTIIRRLKEESNLTVLIVEQNAALVLDIADHGYVMENGRIVLEGPADELRRNSDIKEFYLGLNEIGTRKSYRDVKHYKRRKRWLS